MQPYPTREEALAMFDAARRQHQDFLASIPRERMTEPGATGLWSFKDVIAHVLAYRSSFTASLEALASGQAKPAPPWPADLQDDDSINAWIYEHHRDDRLDDLLSGWYASFDRMRAAFVALPDDVLYDPNYFSWTEGKPLIEALPDTYMGHFNEEHEPAIRAWLAGENAA
ncbi:MAG: DinB family protein [Chloroflexota bacterium]